MKGDLIHADCPLLAKLGKIAVHRVIHESHGWGMPIATYLLTDGNTWSVVDCGWATGQGMPAWERALGELGLNWECLEHIFVTHAHADHIGQAQAMSRRSGRPVRVHPHSLEEAAFCKRSEPEIDAALARFLVSAGYRRSDSADPPPNPFVSFREIILPSHVEDLAPDTAVVIGDCVLQLFLTPGHGKGHICLVDAERRIAFAGDMVLPDVVPIVAFMPNSSDNPLGEYLESLTRLESLGIQTVLPAHGEPVTEPIRHIDATRAYHARQLAWISDKLALGQFTATELVIDRTFRGRRFQDFSGMAQVGMLGEILAYLQFLVAEGSVSSSIDSEHGSRRFGLT